MNTLRAKHETSFKPRRSVYLSFLSGLNHHQANRTCSAPFPFPSAIKRNISFTLPRLRIDGLWYGSLYIELAGTSYIIGCRHVSLMEYKGKGYSSGKSHSLKATVTPMPGMGGQGKREADRGHVAREEPVCKRWEWRFP